MAVESSYVPPEVAAAYAQDDQQGDDQQNQGSGSSVFDPSNSSSQDPSSFDPSSFPPELLNSMGGMGGGSNDPNGSDTSGFEQGQGKGDSVSLKEQLKMLSPLGLLKAITGQIGGEVSQQEKEAQQKRSARMARLNQISQTEVSQIQSKKQQDQMARQQEGAALKSQADQFKASKKHTIFSSPSENIGQADLNLMRLALESAQQEQIAKQQTAFVPRGTQKGPVGFGQLAQTKGGSQMATELTMGE